MTDPNLDRDWRLWVTFAMLLPLMLVGEVMLRVEDWWARRRMK